MIGRRLREERESKKMSRALVASRICTTERTLIKYENDETSMRASELLLLFGIGFDVFYILTGIRLAQGVAEARAEARAEYQPVNDLGRHVSQLSLNAADSALLRQLADRLAGAEQPSVNGGSSGMVTWHEFGDEPTGNGKISSKK